MKKTLVITGSTSGIGYELVKYFALRGDKVIAIARNKELITQCTNNIKKINPNVDLHFVYANLAKLYDIRTASGEIKSILGNEGLDVLINNAATVPNKKVITEDGFEMQYQVNYLSGVYFTKLLQEKINESKGIIITTTSRMHIMASFQKNNIMATKYYHMIRLYCRTKLYNLLFTLAYNHHVAPSTNTKAYAVHPGLVNTGIGTKSTRKLFASIWKYFAKKGRNPEDIVKTYCYIVDNHSTIDYDSYYFHDMEVAIPHKRLVTMKHAQLLWDMTNSQLNVCYSQNFCM